MISLLDVNVLVALFDPAHVHHDTAHQWFDAHRSDGWASCPITENGLVRVISSPAYAGRRTSLEDAIGRLRRFRAAGHHHFWPDSVSIGDEALFTPRHIAGHQQITDVYLLALSVHRDGRLATFDRSVQIASVSGATPAHLVLIEP